MDEQKWAFFILANGLNFKLTQETGRDKFSFSSSRQTRLAIREIISHKCSDSLISGHDSLIDVKRVIRR